MARLRSAGKDKSRISHRQASPRKRSRPTSSGPTPRSGATGRSPSSTCASRRRAACTRASRGSAAAPSARGRSRRWIRVEGAARVRASPREGPRLPALGVEQSPGRAAPSLGESPLDIRAATYLGSPCPGHVGALPSNCCPHRWSSSSPTRCTGGAPFKRCEGRRTTPCPAPHRMCMWSERALHPIAT